MMKNNNLLLLYLTLIFSCQLNQNKNNEISNQNKELDQNKEKQICADSLIKTLSNIKQLLIESNKNNPKSIEHMPNDFYLNKFKIDIEKFENYYENELKDSTNKEFYTILEYNMKNEYPWHINFFKDNPLAAIGYKIDVLSKRVQSIKQKK